MKQVDYDEKANTEFPWSEVIMPNVINSPATVAGAGSEAGAGKLAPNAIQPIPVFPGSETVVALTPANPTTTVSAPASSVAVTVPNASGTVTFSLVVTDNLGVASPPVYASVSVQGPPVAMLTATPATVTQGGRIELAGAGSTSSGSIASYTFSLVPAAVLG